MTSTAFDPFWKFILDEDSDGEEPVQMRTRLNSKLKPAEKGDVRRARFQMNRSRVPADEQDDVSIIELASMDLRTRVVAEEPPRWRFSREKPSEKRDEDNDWGFLNLSFGDNADASQRNLPGKGKNARESHTNDRHFLSMIGMSRNLSMETDAKSTRSQEASTGSNTFLEMFGVAQSSENDESLKITRKSSKQRAGPRKHEDKVVRDEAPGDISFLRLLGISSSAPNEDQIGISKQESSKQEKCAPINLARTFSDKRKGEKNASIFQDNEDIEVEIDSKEMNVKEKSTKCDLPEELQNNGAQEDTSANISLFRLLGIPRSLPGEELNVSSKQASWHRVVANGREQSSSDQEKGEKNTTDSNSNSKLERVLDSNCQDENKKSDRSMPSKLFISRTLSDKVGSMIGSPAVKRSDEIDQEVEIISDENTVFSNERFKFAGKKDPIFPDNLEEYEEGPLTFITSLRVSNNPCLPLGGTDNERKQQAKRQFETVSEEHPTTKKKTMFGKMGRSIEPKEHALMKQLKAEELAEHKENPSKAKQNTSARNKKSFEKKDRSAVASRHSAIATWRLNRMQKRKQPQEKAAVEVCDSEATSLMPSNTALAAVGVAAIGIATASVVAASDLFHSKAKKTSKADRSQEPRNMSVLDFMDVFNSSDEESADESDNELERGNQSETESRRSLRDGSYYSTEIEGDDDKQSPVKEVIVPSRRSRTTGRSSGPTKEGSHIVGKTLSISPEKENPSDRKDIEEIAQYSEISGVTSVRDRQIATPINQGLPQSQMRKAFGKIKGWDLIKVSRCRNGVIAPVDEVEKIGAAAGSDKSEMHCEPHAIVQTDPQVKSVGAQAGPDHSNIKCEQQKIVVAKHDMTITPESERLRNAEIGNEIKLSDAKTRTKVREGFYTYEEDPTSYMDVRYDKYGSRNEICVQHRPRASMLEMEEGDVFLKIEASTISYSDCRIRRGEWWGQSELSLPLIPGVDLVGKIEIIGRPTQSQSGLRRGDRVIALVKHGGNARYTKLRADQLVKVPDGVDSTEAVCLAEAYLSAFQAVHCGQRQITRYSKTALSGKLVLVLGALTNVGEATVKLAIAAGATLVYAPCKDKHRQLVQAMGAAPLSISKDEFMTLLDGNVDLIIDATSDIKSDAVNYFSALSGDGDYILVGRTSDTVEYVLSKWAGSPKQRIVCGHSKLRMANQLHAYDVFEKWESNLDVCKRDLGHLMTLVQAGDISPRVLDRVPLDRVAKTQGILDERRIRGFIVCEPWIKCMSREGPPAP